MEDHEGVVVVGIWQGAGVTLATLQLRTSQDFCHVALWFPDHARQAERVELVDDFAATAAAIMAAINVEDILRGDGQGP